MVEAENTVKICGILNEVKLEKREYIDKVTKLKKNSISGTVNVRLTQKVNGVDTDIIIPVNVFANQFKKDGDPNPTYSDLEDFINNSRSVAACGSIEGADIVYISNAQIRKESYFDRSGKYNSKVKIYSNFINKYTGKEYKPSATFSVKMFIKSMHPEVDADGVETGRLIVSGYMPMYNDNIQTIDFIAPTASMASAISNIWHPKDTVLCLGVLNFTSVVTEKVTEMAIGAPRVEKKINYINEFIIDGGSDPLEVGYNEEEIEAAEARRIANLEATKASVSTKQTTNSFSGGTPKTAADYGF